MSLLCRLRSFVAEAECTFCSRYFRERPKGVNLLAAASKLTPIVSIVVVSLIAVRWLFVSGFLPTHDGEYHLIRFHEFATMLSAGYLFPRWAPNLNSGYGVPLFNFHYPFPNYLGALYHFLGVSNPDAVKLVLATGYLGAVTFCFLWLSRLFDKKVAAVGTIVFSFVPYWFVDIYVRGVVGEVFGITWVMLAFASIERGWKTVAACSIGLLIISHNILSLLFFPVLLVYIFLRNRLFFIPFLLGIGVASYFWIPALVERSYVSGLNSVNFADHFPDLFQLLVPSWGTGFSAPGHPADEMSFQIGLVPLFVLAATLVAILLKDKKQDQEKKENNMMAIGFFLLCAGAFFLMQEGSMGVWQKFPVLSYLQYPWRLLSLFLPSIGFLTAWIVSRLRFKLLSVALIVLAIALVWSYTQPVVYAPRSDAYYLSRPNFTDGTSSLGNSFSTRWSDWKKDRPVKKIEVVNGDAIATGLTTSPLRYQFIVVAKRESIIRVNILYYPGWQVIVNGKSTTIDYEQDGTITFSVLPGQWHVSVRFAETPLRIAAEVLSIVCLFWLFCSSILRRITQLSFPKNLSFRRRGAGI